LTSYSLKVSLPPVLSTASILWLSNLKMSCYYWNHSFSNALNATCKLISLIVGWTDKTLQTSRRQRLILRKDAKFLPQIHNVTMCFNAQPKKNRWRIWTKCRKEIKKEVGERNDRHITKQWKWGEWSKVLFHCAVKENAVWQLIQLLWSLFNRCPLAADS